jgi:hypothetical protein
MAALFDSRALQSRIGNDQVPHRDHGYIGRLDEAVHSLIDERGPLCLCL